MTSVRQQLEHALDEVAAGAQHDDVSSVTVEALASAAGVSRATAYRQFRDRGALLIALAFRILALQAADLDARLASAPTVHLALEEVLVRNCDLAVENRTLSSLLRGPTSAQIYDALSATWADEVLPILKAGTGDGSIRDDVVPDGLARWIAEQCRVMIDRDLSGDAARLWVRRFLVPATTSQDISAVDAADTRAMLDEVAHRIEDLSAAVNQARTSLR